MKNIWKYLIPLGGATVLGIIIGLLLYPRIWGDEKPLPIIQPPETSPVKPKPVKPDTVRIIRYVKVPGKPVPPDVTAVTDLDDGIETPPEIPYYESEVTIFYDATMTAMPKLKVDSTWLAKTTTWAYAKAPVDTFKQELTVKWNLYYKTYVEPEVNERIRSERIGNKFNGALGGISMAAGIAGGEWWSVVGGMTVGYLFLFDVIEIPF